MADLRFGSSVRSVVQLEPGPAGGFVAVEVYRVPGGKKKKGTALLRPLGRTVRRVAEAQKVAGERYLERHNRSNEKKRDGWIRDLGNNVYRASLKGQKALKLDRLFFP